MELGKYLREAREKAGLSQNHVAEKLGYETGQFISNWERNVSHPPIEVLKRIAQMYKVDPEDIYQIVETDLIRRTKSKLERQFKRSIGLRRAGSYK